MPRPDPLPPSLLYNTCDPAALGFATTTYTATNATSVSTTETLTATSLGASSQLTITVSNASAGFSQAATTGADGSWKMLTVKPGSYASPIGERPPHIHMDVTGHDARSIFQMYFPEDEALHAADAAGLPAADLIIPHMPPVALTAGRATLAAALEVGRAADLPRLERASRRASTRARLKRPLWRPSVKLREASARGSTTPSNRRRRPR